MGLDLVELVMEVEEAFDVSVPYNANDPSESDFNLSNVGEIIAGVKQLLAEKADA